MAHELDVNTYNGRRAMFSVRETPWHREGVVLNEAPNFDIAMKLAGCDYEVELQPVYLADGIQVRSGRAIVRTDRNQLLGSLEAYDALGLVSDRYVPLQNRETFGVLEPLLDAGLAKLETGGTLRGGRDAWMLVQFEINDPVVREVFADEVVPFGLITNNHSGEARAQLLTTPIRVVCANTLAAALSGAEIIQVAHRGEARVKVVEAAQQLFSGLCDRYRKTAQAYQILKENRLTVDQFVRTVLNVAAPLPPKAFTPAGEHLTTRGYDAAYEAAEARRDAILAAWGGGIGHEGDGSAWEAVNGAAQVIDHEAGLYRTRGSRVASMMGGRILQLKERVLSSVLQEVQS